MRHLLRWSLLGAVGTAVTAVLLSCGGGGAPPAAVEDSSTTRARGGAVVSLPDHVPGARVVELGAAVDPKTGRRVEGRAIIHYLPRAAKGGKGGGGGKPDKPNDKDPSADCYTFLARGAKWKSVEPYVVNANNTRSLDKDRVVEIVAEGVGKWEAAAGVDILGVGTSTEEALVADLASPDDENEVYFANVEEPNVIAITIMWGIFGGPPHSRELVEWDQIYDDSDFDWSISGEAGKMDLDNIVTHELGHSVGLGDLYESTCGEQTMYGYASTGETKKQTLEAGDIAGIVSLYN